MLGIILLVVVGRYFYRLADEYDKSKWGYAILGLVTYYGTQWVAAILYAIIYFAINPMASEADFSELMAGFIGLVFGIIAAYVLYYLLEKSWRKEREASLPGGIDDIGKDVSSNS